MSVQNKEPYQQAYYPPKPTRLTLFFRKSIIWQHFRFWVINFKIFKLLVKGH